MSIIKQYFSVKVKDNDSKVSKIFVTKAKGWDKAAKNVAQYLNDLYPCSNFEVISVKANAVGRGPKEIEHDEWLEES